MGGCKFGWIDKGLFTGTVLEDNIGHGLWFDHYGIEVDIEDLTSTGNTASGVYLERHPNLVPAGVGGLSAYPNLPISHSFRIEDAHIEGNGVGISGVDSVHVRVAESFISHNHDPKGNGAQVRWTWGHYDDSSTPEGMPGGLHDWTLVRNTYASCADDAFFMYADSQRTASTAEAAVSGFMRSLKSDRNTFLDDPTMLNETGFVTCPPTVPGWPHLDPVPTPGPMTGPFSLDAWRNYTLTDFGTMHGRCSSPSPLAGC